MANNGYERIRDVEPRDRQWTWLTIGNVRQVRLSNIKHFRCPMRTCPVTFTETWNGGMMTHLIEGEHNHEDGEGNNQAVYVIDRENKEDKRKQQNNHPNNNNKHQNAGNGHRNAGNGHRHRVNTHAGAIIGKQGSKIKELREQTSSQMKVFQECCPQSTDRIVLITTAQSKMPNAIKGSTKPYDPTVYDPRLVQSYGGFTGPMPPQMGGPGGMGGGMPTGGYAGFGPGGPPSRGMPPGAPMGMPGNFMQEQVTTTQVTIPNELAGTIIGKGGDRINRIRNESGARIEIGNAYGNEERIITITGSPHQIQSAQYLLQQSVRTSEAGRRYLREQC